MCCSASPCRASSRSCGGERGGRWVHGSAPLPDREGTAAGAGGCTAVHPIPDREGTAAGAGGSHGSASIPDREGTAARTGGCTAVQPYQTERERLRGQVGARQCTPTRPRGNGCEDRWVHGSAPLPDREGTAAGAGGCTAVHPSQTERERLRGQVGARQCTPTRPRGNGCGGRRFDCSLFSALYSLLRSLIKRIFLRMVKKLGRGWQIRAGMLTGIKGGSGKGRWGFGAVRASHFVLGRRNIEM